MAYSHTLYRSIEQVPAAEWDLLRRGDRNPLSDRRYIAAVESAMADTTRFWHVLIRDERQRPMAWACLCSFSIDGTLLAEGGAKRAAAWLNRIAPKLLSFRMLFCGLPASSGDSHLRFATDADYPQVLRILDDLLRGLAKEEKAKCVIFKEFDDAECAQLQTLTELGYRRADSLPMNQANPEYRDFEDYCSKLPSRKRYPIRKSQKKFATSGLRVVQMQGGDGVDQIFTDDVHRLYESVLEKATVRLEHLPAAYFRELARRMPDSSAFTFIYRDQEVVAFAASVFSPTVFHQLFVGVDQKLNPECDLYFNLFFQAMDYGWKLHVQEMPIGQTADAFKQQKLGCTHRPLYFFVKGVTWDSALALRFAFPLLFPPRFTLSQTAETPESTT
jgi:predicted N-acyltransferase